MILRQCLSYLPGDGAKPGAEYYLPFIDPKPYAHYNTPMQVNIPLGCVSFLETYPEATGLLTSKSLRDCFLCAGEPGLVKASFEKPCPKRIEEYPSTPFYATIASTATG